MAVTRLSRVQHLACRTKYEASAIGIDDRAIDLRGELGAAREDRPSVVIDQLIAVHLPSSKTFPQALWSTAGSLAGPGSPGRLALARASSRAYSRIDRTG
ncbi:MAG: hypothetical protein AAB349_05795 [Chloroflexota bacterium]